MKGKTYGGGGRGGDGGGGGGTVIGCDLFPFQWDV